jgi:hypothetical protein
VGAKRLRLYDIFLGQSFPHYLAPIVSIDRLKFSITSSMGRPICAWTMAPSIRIDSVCPTDAEANIRNQDNAHWSQQGSHDFTWKDLGPKRASTPANSEKRSKRAFFREGQGSLLLRRIVASLGIESVSTSEQLLPIYLQLS